MPDPNVPSSRFPAGLQWFNAFDVIGTEPAAATVLRCFLIVPFAHYVRQITIGARDVDFVAGTFGAAPKAAAPGAAKAGATVGTALTATELVATTDVISKYDITLSAVDSGTLRAAGTVYYLELSSNNAGNIFEQPMMSIGVEPSDRTRL